MFQSLIWPCLHLVVNPLYFLLWSLLLIVDLDREDTADPWRVFFSWLDVVKGFFFIIGEDVLCGRSCLFNVAQLTGALLFFSECTKMLIWPLWLFLLWMDFSLMDLFCSWSLTIVCFTCMERSFDCMMWVHSNSFQMQTAHLESTPDLLN